MLIVIPLPLAAIQPHGSRKQRYRTRLSKHSGRSAAAGTIDNDYLLIGNIYGANAPRVQRGRNDNSTLLIVRITVLEQIPVVSN